MKTMLTLLTLVALLGASFVMGQLSPTPPPGVVRPGSDNNDPPAVATWKQCQPRAERFPTAVYNVCLVQITALWLGIDAAEDTKDGRSICFPRLSGGDGMWVLWSAFGRYVEANPKNLDNHIGRIAYRAFLEAYPCKK
jgi:hypothetical protein